MAACEEIVLLVKKVNISMHLFENARRKLDVGWQCSIPHMYTVDDFTAVIAYKCINAARTADSRGVFSKGMEESLPLHIQSFLDPESSLRRPPCLGEACRGGLLSWKSRVRTRPVESQHS